MPQHRLNRTFDKFNLWRELALAGVMVMELSWIVPWFCSITWVTASNSLLRTFVVLAGALFGASLAARGLNSLRIKMHLRQRILLVFLILYVVLATSLLAEPGQTNSLGALIQAPENAASRLDTLLAGDLIVVVAVVLLAWRGIVLAREYAGPVSVYESLRIGVFALAAYSLLVAGPTHTNPTGVVVLFLASGLVAMITARIAILNRLRGGGRHTFDRRWLFSIGSAVSAALTIALGFSWLLISQMERIFKVIQAAFILIVTIVAAPLLLLLALINPQIPRLQMVVPTPTPEADVLKSLEQGKAEQVSQWNFESLMKMLAPYLQLLLVWAIILLVLFFLVRQFKSWSQSEGEDDDTEKQSLLDAGGLRKLLANLLRKAIKNWGSNLASLEKLRPRQRLLAAERVRRIYTLLMDLAEELGKPRPEPHTPLEFLPALTSLLPSRGDDLELLTREYVQVRYGLLPETQEELHAVETAWQRVKTAGEEQKRLKRAAEKRAAPAERLTG